MISLEELRKILPQAYPFLLIDKVVEFKANESLVALKNITANEWATLGNVQDCIYFPETLILEAAAQAVLVLNYQSRPVDLNKQKIYLLGKVKSEFFSQVQVGDQLTLRCRMGKLLESGGFSSVTAYSAEKKIAEIDVFFSIKDKKND